jgi:hypothetical protein
MSYENFEFPVVKRLREKDYDVLTTKDAGNDNQRIPDEDVLNSIEDLFSQVRGYPNDPGNDRSRKVIGYSIRRLLPFR